MATATQPAAPPSLADDRTARPPFSPELKYSGNLFRYSEGRFMYDDTYQLSQRCVHELARIAAETVRASACVKIEKYPDGMYKRTMLLTMDNGAEVVAKIPHPNVGRPHFTTATEVATMDFVRFALPVEQCQDS